MKIHYFWYVCPDMKDGDTYTLDPEQVTCLTCKPRQDPRTEEQAAWDAFEQDTRATLECVRPGL